MKNDFPSVLYLYGFASGPQSCKAQFFKEKFSLLKIHFDIFDYIPNEEAFSNLRTSSLLDDLHSYIQANYENSLILFGSSFGALISAWYASRYPKKIEKLILMAPALRFSTSFICQALGTDPSIWERKGYVNVSHYRYNKEVPLNFSFYEDLLENPLPNFWKEVFLQPILIFHGKFDEVVPLIWSQEFMEFNWNVTLHTLDGDHQLLNQKKIMWKLIKEFFNI
ncbi:MAG: alpha/beta hydrolase [Promethearchaeota archaeon]